MHSLRLYQDTFLTNINKALAQSGSVIACLPTGGGKTVCFAHIAKRAIDKGKTVLIITESTKIFTQIPPQLHHCHEINASVKALHILPNHVYLAMAQTLIRRGKMLEQFIALGKNLLIITDEAHIGTPTKLLSKFDTYKIGFTATPDWRSAKHLPDLYKSCVVGAQVQDLIDQKSLTPYKHFIRTGADTDALKIQNGEFTEESQLAAFETGTLYKGLMDDLRLQKFKKCLIFTSSIKHCHDMYVELTEAGFKCFEAHSEVDCRLNMALYMSLSSNLNICVSVGQLTKGFDFPMIDLIAVVRATTSLPLYLQMLGRGSRIYPGKTHFTVLDYGLNGTRMGLWNADRDWATMWMAQPKKRLNQDSVGGVKQCPKCGALLPVSSRNCPYCAAAIPLNEKELQDGVLVQLNKAYTDLQGLRPSQLTAKQLAVYCRMQNKAKYCARVARSKGEEFMKQYAVEMNYKLNWVQHQLSFAGSEPISFYDNPIM